MDFLNSYIGIIGLAVLFVGAGVYLYSTARKGRSDIIRQDNADLRASNQDKDSKIAGYEATVTAQASEIKSLKEVATQTPAVTQLLELTAKQQQVTNKQHADVIKQLADLAKEISKMTAEFSNVAAQMAKNSKAQDLNTTAQAINTATRKADQ